MGIIEYAFARSRLLAELGQADMVVKITGRLILLNIRSIVSHVLQRTRDGRPFVSAYVNGRCNVGGDCRFIFASPTYMRLITTVKERMWQGFNFERVQSWGAFTMMLQGQASLVFPPLPPRVIGESGNRGCVYDMTRGQYLKACLRHLPRKIAFDLGILPRQATMKAMTKIPDLPDELR